MAIVWLTGLPCSGKTTIAKQLQLRLEQMGKASEVLDGDEVRTWLTDGLGFSTEDRYRNIMRVGHVARLLSRNGVVAICSLVSPYETMRQRVRSAQSGYFLEVYVKTPLEVCMKRDVKGMYKRALAGEIVGFTGVDDIYEPPLNPHIAFDASDLDSLPNIVEQIVFQLRAAGVV